MNVITNDDLNKFRESWAKAVRTSNLEDLLNLYSKEALLKPTLSERIRSGIDEIIPYFKDDSVTPTAGFLYKGIDKVEFTQSHSKIKGDIALDIGQYIFYTNDGNSLDADYTFVLERNEKSEIVLISHHSSLTYKG